MAQTKKIMEIAREMTADPFLMQELIDAGKPGRKSRLRQLGADKLERTEVRKVLEKLMTERTAAGGASPERPVEWVAAVATLVAGALAA